jgi:hypothetical protein
VQHDQDRPDDAEGQDAASEPTMRQGLDREYASMGTGEAGAGVGGGGASSSDVEWDAAGRDPLAAADRPEPDDELTSGGAMTNEEEFVDGET